MTATHSHNLKYMCDKTVGKERFHNSKSRWYTCACMSHDWSHDLAFTVEDTEKITFTFHLHVHVQYHMHLTQYMCVYFMYTCTVHASTYMYSTVSEYLYIMFKYWCFYQSYEMKCPQLNMVVIETWKDGGAHTFNDEAASEPLTWDTMKERLALS